MLQLIQFIFDVDHRHETPNAWAATTNQKSWNGVQKTNAEHKTGTWASWTHSDTIFAKAIAIGVCVWSFVFFYSDIHFFLFFSLSIFEEMRCAHTNWNYMKCSWKLLVSMMISAWRKMKMMGSPKSIWPIHLIFEQPTNNQPNDASKITNKNSNWTEKQKIKIIH